MGWASLVTLVVKNLSAGAEDTRVVGSIPGLGRFPGGGHSDSFQYSCLENPTDRGAWWATVYGVTKELDMIQLLKVKSLSRV